MNRPAVLIKLSDEERQTLLSWTRSGKPAKYDESPEKLILRALDEAPTQGLWDLDRPVVSPNVGDLGPLCLAGVAQALEQSYQKA